MFNSRLNVISGERKSGRSSFLFKLSDFLIMSGAKVYFLGSTHEFSDSRIVLNQFAGFDFLNSSDVNNSLILDKISELSLRGHFNILLIDDIDYLSHTIIKRITSMPFKKIVTCLSANPEILTQNFEEYRIVNEFDHKLRKSIQLLLNHGERYLIDDIFKSFSRNEKINILLNDKGR